MKKDTEIKVVKADIRRMKNRNQYLSKGEYYSIYKFGLRDAIATLEKYLKKIERSK